MFSSIILYNINQKQCYWKIFQRNGWGKGGIKLNIATYPENISLRALQNHHHWITGIHWYFSAKLIFSLNHHMISTNLQWYFVLMSSKSIVNWQTNIKNVLELHGFPGSGKIGQWSVAYYMHCYGDLML